MVPSTSSLTCPLQSWLPCGLLDWRKSTTAAGGPFLVGMIAARGTDTVVGVLFYVGFIPLIGLLFMPWVIETRGKVLAD